MPPLVKACLLVGGVCFLKLFAVKLVVKVRRIFWPVVLFCAVPAVACAQDSGADANSVQDRLDILVCCGGLIVGQLAWGAASRRWFL